MKWIMNERKVLPPNLHDILIGIMLGDGHIYKSSPTSNSRFEISFGKDRASFANWVEDLFKVYSKNGIQKIYYNHDIFNPKFGYRFKTQSLPLFNYYHNLFYKRDNNLWKYKKIVPENINEIMNSRVLAYLIMSDGNFDNSRKRIRIYTNSYSKSEVTRLAESINSNLNIYVGVLHDRKDQWILTIGAKQLEKLRNLVKPHFESSMLYRLGL
jgi:hypothetical protein